MNLTSAITESDQLKDLPALFEFTGLEELRRAGRENLLQTDFPKSKDEAWKYTRVQGIARRKWALQPDASSAAAHEFKLPQQHHLLVFVNGFFDAANSQILSDEALHIAPLTEAPAALPGSLTGTSSSFFHALNAACFTGGAFLHFKGKSAYPVYLLHLASADKALAQPRHFILAEPGSEGSVVQLFQSEGTGESFTNCFTEVQVNANARLHLDVLQRENDKAYLLHHTEVQQQRDSFFAVATLTLDGAWVRNNLNIASVGTNTETHLSGLYALTGTQHADNHTLMDHRSPNCFSSEIYKGIADGSATGVFNGKVFVRRDSQKINAYQSNANLILSETASINTKPELEIYADDVKCSHGSTTGQLDEEALFYLRARGIGEANARKLLVRAFVGDVLEKIHNEALREQAGKWLDQRFN